MGAIHSPRRALMAGLAVLLAVGPASGGVRRDDTADGVHTALGGQPMFDAVGQVVLAGRDGAPDAVCSGTHIGNGWILTAAHCFTSREPGQTVIRDAVEFVRGPFGLGSGEPVDVADRLTADAGTLEIHPDWSGDAFLTGVDLALFRLSEAPEDLPTVRLAPGGFDPIGLTGTPVGYGRGGVGSVGWPTSADGGVGTKRGGENVVDLRGGQIGSPQVGGIVLDTQGVAPTVLFTDFDEPGRAAASLTGSTAPLALEYAIAPGDSGGLLAVADPAGRGGPLLVGVHSFGASVSGTTMEGINVGDIDGFLNSTYGELQGYAEVAPFVDSFIEPITGVPEPATTLLLLAAAAGPVAARRNRA